MEAKKLLTIIFSLIFVGGFVFAISWGITNYNNLQDALSGTGIYTEEDLNNAYEDGYNTAFVDKAEYEKLIGEYRVTIADLTDSVNILTSTNKDYETQIELLEKTKNENEVFILDLQNIVNLNNASIVEKDNKISDLEKIVADLSKENQDNDILLEQVNSELVVLRETKARLENENQTCLDTITLLNLEIQELNSRITEMTSIYEDYSTTISNLTTKIYELEQSIEYYESYLAGLETEIQVVATFEFDGVIYNVQTVAKNSKLNIEDPVSTDYVIFNGWTVNGELIDIDTYQITANTKFVADVTYKYSVKYVVNNEEHSSQIILKDSYCSLPGNPVIEGYDFDGWTINGIDIIDPTTVQITNDITFVAKLTQLHTVTFMYDGLVLETKTVRNGDTVIAPEVDNQLNKVFNGWKVNGLKVEINNYLINSSLTFEADLLNSNFVERTVSDVNLYGNSIFTFKDKAYYSYNGTHYILDIQTNTWSKANYNENINLDSRYFWSDGDNLYCSISYYVSAVERYESYLYDIDTNMWSKIDFNFNFDGLDIFYIDNEVYFRNANGFILKFNKVLLDWEIVYQGATNSAGNLIFDGETLYAFYSNSNIYSYSKEDFNVTLLNNSGLNINQNNVWCSKGNIYCTVEGTVYKLNKTSYTWEVINFSGVDFEIVGSKFFNIGNKTYYQDGTILYEFVGA